MIHTEPTGTSPAFDTLRRCGTAHILLAEDNPVIQEMAASLIERAGLKVDVANNGREAVAMAAAAHYDLVLMDLQMPLLDGVAAARELRAAGRTRHTPIIAMTTDAGKNTRADCLAAGMDDHLVKPVDPALLYEVLAHWLCSDAVPVAPATPAAPRPATARPASPAGTLPRLNTAHGLAFFAEDHAVYEQALRQFVNLYGGGIARVNAALDTRERPLAEPEAEALRRALHSIGGAATAIGAQRLHRQAADLERALGDKPKPRDAPAVAGLADIAAELSAVIALLRERLVRPT